MRKIELLFVSVIISFIACTNTAKGGAGMTMTESEALPVSSISIFRLDKDLHNYITEPTDSRKSALIQNYLELLEALELSISNKKSDSDAATLSNIVAYYSHPMLAKVYEETLFEFNNVSQFEKELTNASGLISEHLPNQKLPRLAMHISGFKENVIVTDKCISVSIDKYLGKDTPYYQGYFELYQRQQMEPRYIVRDYMKAWLMSYNGSFYKESEDKTLLGAMIKEGKLLYTLSVLLPEYPKSDLIGYSLPQMEWSAKNEKESWDKILKSTHLYTKDYLIVSKYINEASYTSPLGTASPARMGCWIGWQIVNQYAMNTNKSLAEVLQTDAQTILKESKYK